MKQTSSLHFSPSFSLSLSHSLPLKVHFFLSFLSFRLFCQKLTTENVSHFAVCYCELMIGKGKKSFLICLFNRGQIREEETKVMEVIWKEMKGSAR